MYKVTRRESPKFPKNIFSIWYEVDFDGDNHEWRDCVDDILKRFRKSHTITPVNVPKFEPLEDFVELTYKIDNQDLVLSSDFLLYTIYVTTNSIELTQKLCIELGNQVGWEE